MDTTRTRPTLPLARPGPPLTVVEATSVEAEAPALPALPVVSPLSIDQERMRRLLRPGQVERIGRDTGATLAQAEALGVPITFVGLAEMPDRPRLYPGGANDWALLRIEDDPLYRSGRFPIPRAARRDLKALSRGGVEMDTLLVAHEIPGAHVGSVLPARPEGGPVPLDPEALDHLIEHPGPTGATRATTERAGEIAGKVGRAARIAGKGAAAAGAGLGAVAMAPLALLAMDPIIFGARRCGTTGRVVAVYELVRWEWS